MMNQFYRGFKQAKKLPNCLNLAVVRYQSSQYGEAHEGLLIESKNKVVTITLNRPKKYNALTRAMYQGMTDVFTRVNQDANVKAVVLTGSGDYYSSGNDLSNLTEALKDPEGPKAGMTKSKDLLIQFVDSIINLEKFLIAAVNGPAVGIPVTTLGLCDYVIASDKSTFQTPFTAIGQCPEACSSITFPQIMGTSRASELLLLNHKWTAKRAKESGLISEIVENDKFHAFLDNLLHGKQGLVSSCYPNSMRVCKSLIRSEEAKKLLREVNRIESETIVKLWLSEESIEAAQKFVSRSKGVKSAA